MRQDCGYLIELLHQKWFLRFYLLHFQFKYKVYKFMMLFIVFWPGYVSPVQYSHICDHELGKILKCLGLFPTFCIFDRCFGNSGNQKIDTLYLWNGGQVLREHRENSNETQVLVNIIYDLMIYRMLAETVMIRWIQGWD